ncbi:hypothetical protein M0802_001243 [Mischocyttarus mexicanus]|nr:hypothetical protein M0802_001243 [Mischocyttarus mexicanus]
MSLCSNTKITTTTMTTTTTKTTSMMMTKTTTTTMVGARWQSKKSLYATADCPFMRFELLRTASTIYEKLTQAIV